MHTIPFGALWQNKTVVPSVGFLQMMLVGCEINTSAFNTMVVISGDTPKKLGNCPSCPSCPSGANGAKAAKEGCLSTETSQEEAQHLEKWYDNYEVMKMFHISQRTLQTLRSNGKLPFAKLGNKCFYREQDLQLMMMESFRDSRVKFAAQEAPDKKKEQKGGGAWQ